MEWIVWQFCWENLLVFCPMPATSFVVWLRHLMKRLCKSVYNCKVSGVLLCGSCPSWVHFVFATSQQYTLTDALQVSVWRGAICMSLLNTLLWSINLQHAVVYHSYTVCWRFLHACFLTENCERIIFRSSNSFRISSTAILPMWHLQIFLILHCVSEKVPII